MCILGRADSRTAGYISLHVTGIAEVLSGLVGSLVGAILKVDNALTRSELLVGEFSLVLFGWLGSDERSGEFGMKVASSSNSKETLHNLGDVTSLIKINRLKHVNFRHTPSLARLLETVDVFHLFELSARGIDLGDAFGNKLIHEVAENNSILKNVLEGSSGKLLSEDVTHPGKDVSFELSISLAGDFVGHAGTKSILRSTTHIEELGGDIGLA